MKNVFVNSKQELNSQRRNTADFQKVVVFGMGNINLALPSDSVYKVTNQSAVSGTGLNGVGITHIGDRQVMIIELHRRFFAPKGKYLLIAESKQGELFGIPVASVPTLMEIPVSKIQPLPESYRHADLLAIASQVCHIPQTETPLTIFLLDIDQLLPNA